MKALKKMLETWDTSLLGLWPAGGDMPAGPHKERKVS